MIGTSAVTEAGQSHGQTNVRGRNARKVLSLIRRTGTLPSADIARRSGLSAQTVSNIIRALEAEGVLVRGEAVAGKVGKPSVPVSLRASGVHALGLNIGRRASELVLVDFLGREIERRTTSYAFPTTDRVSRFLVEARADIVRTRPEAEATIVGLGVAAPFGLWNWLEVVDAPAAEMEEWQRIDFETWIGKETGLPVVHANDATSACMAEHLLGHGRELADFGYVFVGAFVGGGLVIGGRVEQGPSGNSGALGPMLVPDDKGGMTQLLNVASLHRLERDMAKAGVDPAFLREAGNDWSSADAAVRDWIARTAPKLAIAAINIGAVVDIEAVVLDAAMPEGYRDRLAREVEQALADLPTTGIVAPRILPGQVGRAARSIGAALLPIDARFFSV